MDKMAGNTSLRLSLSFPPCPFSPKPPPPSSQRLLPHLSPIHYRNLCCSHQHNAPLFPSLATTLGVIHSSSIIACLRAKSGEVAMEAAKDALDGGISVLKITMTTPDVFEVLQGLMKLYPSSILRVGTILNDLDVKSTVKVGAKFFMSPATVKDILDSIQESELLYILGVMTPTEVKWSGKL